MKLLLESRGLKKLCPSAFPWKSLAYAQLYTLHLFPPPSESTTYLFFHFLTHHSHSFQSRPCYSSW